jgi:NIMA (never in mitosis gene a)-related kinase
MTGLISRENQTTLKDFHIERKIGDGAYSQVFQVMRRSDSKEYALKQVRIAKLSEKEKTNALNEVRILASIEHPNVIAYKEAFFDEQSSTLNIVMDFADGGDLYNKILQMKKQGRLFDEWECWDCLIQMTRGLQALHERGVLHRDLKSANVFMEIDGLVKLGDLNVSKQAQKDGMLFTQTGTPYYASPEVWKDQPYDNKSDIWSLGCVLYEMVTLNPPFQASNMDKLFRTVLSGNYEKIPAKYSPKLNLVLSHLLQVNP